MSRLLAILAATFALTPPALADEMQPILRLDTLLDEKVERSIVLYANDIDPNSSSVDDRYRLTVDGAEIAAPPALLARLDRERRGYSYDTFTNGIRSEEAQIRCMMAGPASGHVLSVLYLTYDDTRIVSSEMRPVLSRPENCLFITNLRPISEDARTEAAAAMATLRTISEILGE
jgi:hypothetical protein